MTEVRKTKGLRFEYLIPHLTENFKTQLANDSANIKKCFDLSDGASQRFQEELKKQLTKNGIKPFIKPNIFKAILFKLL